ncbi:MAG: PEGA domain-containing protein [Planctomycetota bacterium]
MDHVAKYVVRAACLLVVAGGFAGCVQRTISITSEPAGALVWLNDEEVGRTPLEVPFRWYGTYDVRLEKDGFVPRWTTGEAQQPWWEYPGPDLVAELLPGAESRVAWHYELTEEVPAAEQDAGALIERARGMRDETRGFVEDR